MIFITPAEEAPQAMSRPWHRPLGHRGDLVSVHGVAARRDDVAQVCHRRGPERALGALQMKSVRPECVENGAQMLQELKVYYYFVMVIEDVTRNRNIFNQCCL